MACSARLRRQKVRRSSVDAGLARRARDEQLADRGHHAARGGPEVGAVGVGGQLAPAEHAQALLGRERVDLGRHLGGPFGGQEGEARGVGALGGQLERDDRAVERIRDLQQDARAVTRVDLGAAGAAVFEAQERGERPAHDAVVAAALEVGHHGDAAGVVLELRDVQVCRWPSRSVQPRWASCRLGAPRQLASGRRDGYEVCGMDRPNAEQTAHSSVLRTQRRVRSRHSVARGTDDNQGQAA